MAIEQSARTSGTIKASNGEAVRALGDRLRENVQRVIVGKREAIDQVLAAVLACGHVLIEDLPGTGKTTLCKSLASSLDCSFSRIQCTPDLVPSDVLGVNVFDARSHQFDFRHGPVFANVVLADEINRATPRTQSALLEAMQEEQVSVDGVTQKLPSPFIVAATLNPVEMEGTFPLPEAQLDRFLLRVSMGYPTLAEESELLERFQAHPETPEIEPVAGREDVLAARRLVQAIRVEPPARDYMLALIRATRGHDKLRLGASPRASLALQRAAQAAAALEGRSYVIPDDVKRMATAVLAHRIILDATATLRGTNAAEIVSEILRSVPVPLDS
ncbi:MAG: MoxR family ATPase [Gammaproteobacteria bacterium]|nr:MoxR family ATPase [Gammaproteobacteria bacterium]